MNTTYLSHSILVAFMKHTVARGMRKKSPLTPDTDITNTLCVCVKIISFKLPWPLFTFIYYCFNFIVMNYVEVS